MTLLLIITITLMLNPSDEREQDGLLNRFGL
jgi:hypothetical protein